MIQTGTLFNDIYRILSELTHDDISTTHMALNEKTNEICVIKQIKKIKSDTSDSFSDCMISKIETIKNNNHPALQRIIDIIEEDSVFLVIMDYVKGDSLDKILKEQGAFSPESATEIVKQLCRVFDYFNSIKQSVDIKNLSPENIVLQEKGNVIILNSAITNIQEHHTDKTEVFCLGEILFGLLTNSDPDFNSHKGTSVRKINLSLPENLDRITAKCLEKNPEDQYKKSSELLDELENINNADNLSQKSNNLKLRFFILSVILTIVFAASSVSCYLLSTSKKDIPADAEEISSDVYFEEESASGLYDTTSENPTDSETLTTLISNKGELM